MYKILNKLGPYGKVLVLMAALGVAIAAQVVGVDLGLDPDEIWKLLGAAVLVLITPAPGYIRTGISSRQ